jgi:hypothetical protein
MVPEEMAAVLRASKQMCYYMIFFARFVTYFVHNVSSTIFYGKKELLDIRIRITHLGLDKYFFLQQAGRTGYTANTRQGRHPHYWPEKETQVQRTQSGVPHKDLEKARGNAAVTVNITHQRTIIGQ